MTLNNIPNSRGGSPSCSHGRPSTPKSPADDALPPVRRRINNFLANCPELKAKLEIDSEWGGVCDAAAASASASANPVANDLSNSFEKSKIANVADDDAVANNPTKLINPIENLVYYNAGNNICTIKFDEGFVDDNESMTAVIDAANEAAKADDDDDDVANDLSQPFGKMNIAKAADDDAVANDLSQPFGKMNIAKAADDDDDVANDPSKFIIPTESPVYNYNADILYTIKFNEGFVDDNASLIDVDEADEATKIAAFAAANEAAKAADDDAECWDVEPGSVYRSIFINGREETDPSSFKCNKFRLFIDIVANDLIQNGREK